MPPVRPRATGQDALGLDEVRARAFRREPGARGLYPKSKPPFLRVVLILPIGIKVQAFAESLLTIVKTRTNLEIQNWSKIGQSNGGIDE